MLGHSAASASQDCDYVAASTNSLRKDLVDAAGCESDVRHCDALADHALGTSHQRAASDSDMPVQRAKYHRIGKEPGHNSSSGRSRSSGWGGAFPARASPRDTGHQGTSASGEIEEEPGEEEDNEATEPPGVPDEDMLEPFGDNVAGDIGAPLDVPDQNLPPDFDLVGDDDTGECPAQEREPPHDNCIAAESPSADTCALEQSDWILGFAMGLHTRLGSNSLVRILNNNIVQSILVCHLTVGPSNHFSNLSAALSSGQARSACTVRINLEAGLHKMDYEVQVTHAMRLDVRPVPGSVAGSVILSSCSGRALLRVANADAVVCLTGVTFVSKLNAEQTSGNLKQRCIWVTHGRLMMRHCNVSSETGIGICVLGSAVVRCEMCVLSDCGFVGVAAAQGGRAEVLDGCIVTRNRHFGLLATDMHSSILMHNIQLTSNATYGAGVGLGARLRASHCQILSNQIGVVSKGKGSHVFLESCDISRNHRMGLGAREGATAVARDCRMTRNTYGMCVSNAGSQVWLMSCHVNQNTTHGLGANQGGQLTASACQVGLNPVGLVSKGANSKATLRACHVNDNTRIGVGIREGGKALCQGCSITGNQYGVCSLNPNTSVTLLKCDASNNDRYGVSASDRASVEAIQCNLDNNLQLGIGAWHANSRVVLVDCTANNNGTTGVAARAGSSITAQGCSITKNKHFGVYVSGMGSTIKINECDASENGLYGIAASEHGLALVEQTSTTRNVQAGVVAKDAGSCVMLRHCDASHNGRIGVAAISGALVEAIGTTMCGNARLGLGVWHAHSKVTLHECEASNNGGTGLTAIQGARLVAHSCLVKGNSNVGAVCKDIDSVIMLHSSIVSHHARLGVGARSQGRVEAVECSMLHNAQSGVAVKDAGTSVSLIRCSLLDNGNYGLCVRERATVVAEHCQFVRNRHMGVCVWHETSHVALRHCSFSHNAHYPAGTRDGAVIHWLHSPSLASHTKSGASHTKSGVDMESVSVDTHTNASKWAVSDEGDMANLPTSASSCYSWACADTPPAFVSDRVPAPMPDLALDLGLDKPEFSQKEDDDLSRGLLHLAPPPPTAVSHLPTLH